MASHIKLILLEDIENLGLAGEEISVAPGYARNYLIPRNLATKASPAALRLLAARKEKIEAKRAQDLAAAQELAAKLTAIEISIAAQAAADDQLFGSVTARTIAEKLAENGFAIDYNRIRLESPIKLIGEYTVDVKLHANVIAPVKVWVVRG